MISGLVWRKKKSLNGSLLKDELINVIGIVISVEGDENRFKIYWSDIGYSKNGELWKQKEFVGCVKTGSMKVLVW